MHRLIVILLVLVAITSAQLSQTMYNTKWSNFIQHGFNGTEATYSMPFSVGDYENVTVQARFNDSTNAGYSGDSCAFLLVWQAGYITYNSSATLDTSWYPRFITIDTINSTVANFSNAFTDVIGSDGEYTETLKKLDSTSVSGFITYTRSITVPPSMIARVGAIGITGNKTVTPIKLSFDVYQRKATKVDYKEPISQ